MKVSSAQFEVEQMAPKVLYSDCAGDLWGWRYGGEWQPRYPHSQRVCKQLSIDGEDYVPHARAYAAQATWNERLARLWTNGPSDRVPKPPSYSTPERVSSRAREAGTGANREVYIALAQKGKVYRQFREAVMA